MEEKYKAYLEMPYEEFYKKTYMGFVGFPNASDLIMDVVLDLLGEDFSYYFYDCNQSLDMFNRNTTIADGTHPTVKDFGELWEFSQKTWR